MKVKELIEKLLDLPMDGELYVDTEKRFVNLKDVKKYDNIYQDKSFVLVLKERVICERDIPQVEGEAA